MAGPFFQVTCESFNNNTVKTVLKCICNLTKSDFDKISLSSVPIRGLNCGVVSFIVQFGDLRLVPIHFQFQVVRIRGHIGGGGGGIYEISCITPLSKKFL